MILRRISGSFYEATVLTGATLLLIAVYLGNSGSITQTSALLFLCGLLILVGAVGSVWTSYHQIEETLSSARRSTFRINAQLTKTLAAEGVRPDVIFGLNKLIKDGDVTITGETEFLDLLENTIGLERTREMKPVILKYSRIREQCVDSPPANPASVS